MRVINVGLMIVVVVQLINAGCGRGQQSARSDYDRQKNLVSQGWHLVKRWDFYNEILDWNHTTITEGKRGGVVVVKDGSVGFGYARDGGYLFYQSRVTPLPNFNYMLIARVKTNKPYRALMGFYDKVGQNVLGAHRIKSTDWQVISSVISFNPTSGERIPVLLYPAFHNLTYTDYTYVDWVEFWIYPDKELYKDELGQTRNK